MAASSSTLALLLFIFVSAGASTATNFLFSPSSLRYGTQLWNGEHSLSMLHSCDAVLYNGGRKVWSTNTSGLATHCYFALAQQGRLEVNGIRGYHVTVWDSGTPTWGKEHALVLKPDGTLRVYGYVVWSSASSDSSSSSSSSNERLPSAVQLHPESNAGGKILLAGDIAPVGTVAHNWVFTAELLPSCNLTLSDTRTGEILWHSNTASAIAGDCLVALERNGELKIKHLDGSTLWTAGRMGPTWSDYVLGVQYGYVSVPGKPTRLAVFGPTAWSRGGPSHGGNHIAMVTAAN